jgi:hypothetical protein
MAVWNMKSTRLLSRDTVLINFLTDLNYYDSYKITYPHNCAELNI